MEYFQIQISQKRSETSRQTAELSSFICLRNVPAPSSHMMGTRLPFPGTGSLLVPSCCRLCPLLRVDSPAAGFCPWSSTKRPRAMKEPRAGGKSCPCPVVARLWLWICPARRCGRAAGDRSQPWGDTLGAGDWHVAESCGASSQLHLQRGAGAHSCPVSQSKLFQLAFILLSKLDQSRDLMEVIQPKYIYQLFLLSL